MGTTERPRGLALRLSGLPAASEQGYAGGTRFVAHCLAGDVRAQQRRDAIRRAWAAHRRASRDDANPYPTALILCQRLSVALEDVGRLVLALEVLGDDDPFDRMRFARYDELDDAFRRLADNQDALREALRLPVSDNTADLGEPLRGAILAASDAMARRWAGHWARCGDGWALLRRLGKALRHGSPLLTRDVVFGPPGAGALGEGLEDRFDRWVLLVGTEVDHEAAALNTTYAQADISDETLARGRHAGVEAVALARELSAAHVHRVQHESKWALPRDALSLVASAERRVLREHALG